MMPNSKVASGALTLLFSSLVCCVLPGCRLQQARAPAQSPDESEKSEKPDIKLVGDVAVPFGLQPIVVEAVGLVTGLPGTGSDPEPSPYRAVMISEMQKRGIKNPNEILASPSTALVLVRAYLRPGIQKDDTFDVEVRIPSRDQTTSLRGGWLMSCMLREEAVLGGEIRQGHALAVAEGPVMVDPGADGKNDSVILCRGRVLGGGRSLKARPMTLVLQSDSQSVRISSQVGASIDRRFNTYDHGIKGVAVPKNNEYIELNLHSQYKNNVPRYLQVIRAIPLRESAQERSERITTLEKQLLDPFMSSRGALKLEAIGHEAIPTLKRGLASDDAEIRFYSAEALAYLDQSTAAAPLAAAARDEAAFRVFALTALSALDEVTAYEELRKLLDLPSAETRYGAFRALWAMDERDPFVKGESLSGKFSYHVLDTSGPPLIHATRSYRPEIVVFGHEQRFKTPLILEAGPRIMMQSIEGERVVLSKFTPGEPDQKREVSTLVDEVIRAIVDLGGNYPDVVQVLQQAEEKHVLSGKFEVDALPEAGRTYDRKDTEVAKNTDESKPRKFTVAHPLPNLFPKKEKDLNDEPKVKESRPKPKEEEEPGFGAKVKKWFTPGSAEGAG